MTSETPGSLKLTNSGRESTIYQATRFKDYKGLCKVVAEWERGRCFSWAHFRFACRPHQR